MADEKDDVVEDDVTPDANADAVETPNGDETDWKAHSRKHERRWKEEAALRRDVETRLKEFEDRDKSDQEKAIEKARNEAIAEAKAEVSAERRAYLLESAVTRLAARGIQIKNGDKDEVVKFADPEDALLNIKSTADDLFDDEDRVNTDALEDALKELARKKPHLLATSGKDTPPSLGTADAGRGGGSQTSGDEPSIDEIFKRKSGAST